MEKIKWPSPMKAIRAKCLECVGFNSVEIKNCLGYNCVLYPYRFGHRNSKIKSTSNMCGWDKQITFEKNQGAGVPLD